MRQFYNPHLIMYIIHYKKPALVVQCFKWSSCTDTSSSVIVRWFESGDSNCNKPLYPSEGQWLPYWGCDMEKTISLPLQNTYLEVMSSNCNYFKKIFIPIYETILIPILKLLMFILHYKSILQVYFREKKFLCKQWFNLQNCVFFFTVVRLGSVV